MDGLRLKSVIVARQASPIRSPHVLCTHQLRFPDHDHVKSSFEEILMYVDICAVAMLHNQCYTKRDNHV